MYRKRNDAIVFFSSLDTALNRLIRFKFIYKLFHLERNSKKCMQTCLQTYSQFYILPCFFKHLREALQRQVIFLLLLFIYAIQDLHSLEKRSSNDISNYLVYYQVLCWFSSLRDRGTNGRVCKDVELTD